MPSCHATVLQWSLPNFRNCSPYEYDYDLRWSAFDEDLTPCSVFSVQYSIPLFLESIPVAYHRYRFQPAQYVHQKTLTVIRVGMNPNLVGRVFTMSYCLSSQLKCLTYL